MKRRLLLLALVFGISLPSFTQTSDVDVTKLVADTKTFIFNNNKNTVKGYIYSQLKDVTGCCGNDRIYLEVKIDPSGYVLNVKTLTGKNDCFKQSAIDIVKNVKWDASDFKGPKSIYFEIKPNIECEGNRENTYAQVEIFNNELLDTEGNRNGNNATALNTVRNSDPIADNTTTQNKTETKTAEKEEPKTDPKVAKKDPIASNTQPVKKDPPQQQATRSQDPTPKADNTVAIKNEPPAKTKEEQEAEAKKKADELAAAKKKAAEERAAQEEEINKLKEQMARLRSQEEAARERRLAQERAEADRERERKERDAQMAQNNDDNSGEGGGLFLDDVADSNRDNGTVSNDNEPPTGRTEEERIQNELAQLEAQKREIEQKMRDSENNTRQLLQENDRASQEWLRVEEQILEKKERMAQQREDQELNRLEEDRRKAQDRERQSSDEYQRMMDEIRRLQQEADRKIAELETQKQDIERLAAAKQAREQEIMLARTLRETEIEQELESKRLTVMNSGRAAMNPTSIADVTTPSSGEVNLGDMAIPVLTTKEDSQKYIALARTVNLLKVELERLREQLRIMEGGAPSPNSSSIASNSAQSKPRRSNGNLTNAADDKKNWDNIDYLPPNADKKDYVVVATTRSQVPVVDKPATNQTSDQSTDKQGNQNQANKEVPKYQSGEGYQPAPDHKNTYKNVAGPKFYPRHYVDGRAAMKDKIYSNLKDAGVCGLGQATFSVTVDPKGNVLKSQVLAASSALVELQLGAILPTFKFNEVDVRYDQTVYLEFKADIACDGVEDVKLQEVESIIKNKDN